MELVQTPWHVFGAALVFVLGGGFALKVGRLFRQPDRRSLVLYLWHTLLCLAYMFYVLGSGGDALAYYQTSLAGGVEFSVGTAGIMYLTKLFTSVLGLSLLGTFLAYNIFGFVGLMAFDAAARAATAAKGKAVRIFATVVVFLPSVSFWSSAIGKDAISFAATGLALWAALELRHRGWLMLVAILLMLLVRPHMAAIMVMAVAVSMMVQPRVPILQRLFIGGFAIAIAAALVPYALNYAGVGGGGMDDISEYVDQRQAYNMEGGGGVDIASMPLPVKMFTYLFRPLPIEAHSAAALMASLDNVILLVLAIVGGVQIVRRKRASIAANRTFLWTYALTSWLVLGLTTANLGISVRQKWMFAPMLIFLLLSVIGRPRRMQAGRGSIAVGAS